MYAGDALGHDSAQYKSIMALPDTSALEVIRRTLTKYDAVDELPLDFELHFVKVYDKSEKRRSSFALFFSSQKEESYVLKAYESPVMIAELFQSETRR